MVHIKNSSLRIKRINLICLLIFGFLSACSEPLKNEDTNYSIVPGWYKLEGIHKATMTLEGQSEEILTEKSIDDYVCIDAEEAKRKTKKQIVDNLEENGFEVLEVKTTPFKDIIRVTPPTNNKTQHAAGLTIIEYRPDFKAITATIDGTLNHINGSGSALTKTTMTWVNAECKNASQG